MLDSLLASLSDPNFDYHLKGQERNIILQHIPRSHRGQRTACHFNVIIDQQPVQNVVVIRLNYLIRILKITKQDKCKLLHDIHILKIHSIQTIDDNTAIINFSDHRIIFWCKICDRFVHKLLRDYYYVSMITLSPSQLVVVTHDKEKYPPFMPHLSFSQSIQFLYDALCTYYKAPYRQEFVQFFHYLITAENVIFDMNLIHFHLIDSKFTKEKDLKPLFAVLRYIPYFVGITCSKVNIENGLSLVASVIRYSNYIKFIAMPKCGMLNGARKFGSAIRTNPRLTICYIDISGNKLNDMEYLMSSLEYLKSPLYYLNLADCNMSAEATYNLINSIVSNKNLWALTFLDISGSKMSREAIQLLSVFITEHPDFLQTFRLGTISQGIQIFTNALTMTPTKIKSLSLAGIKMTDESANDLLLFVNNIKSLQELDISRTTLKPAFIANIITAISNNNEINWFSIHLNSLGINRGGMTKVKSAFESSRLRMWLTISLEDNGMNADDLQQIMSVFRQMINLTQLNLGLNFDSSTIGIENLLPNFLNFQRLDRLSLRGGNGRALGFEKLKNLCKNLLLIDRTFRLDVSNNLIGSAGLKAFKEIITANKLIELQIDGSEPENLEQIIEFCDCICENSTITMIDFPMKDANKIAENAFKMVQKVSIEKISDYYVKMNLQLARNWSDCGIHSKWTNIGEPHMEQIVDDMIYQFHKDIQNLRVNKHSFAIETVGLPLPYQDIGDKVKHGGDREMTNYPADEIYFSPPNFIIEPPQPFTGMHFTSLKMRKPGCDQTTDDGISLKRRPSDSSIQECLISLSSEERKLAQIFDDEDSEFEEEEKEEEEDIIEAAHDNDTDGNEKAIEFDIKSSLLAKSNNNSEDKTNDNKQTNLEQ